MPSRNLPIRKQTIFHIPETLSVIHYLYLKIHPNIQQQVLDMMANIS